MCRGMERRYVYRRWVFHMMPLDTSKVSLYLYTAVCEPPCENGGSCALPENCTCAEGWRGDTCTEGGYIITFHMHLDTSKSLLQLCVNPPVKMMGTVRSQDIAHVQRDGQKNIAHKVGSSSGAS